MPRSNIYHFYHIWADGDWQESVEEHINALERSNLIRVLSSFEVGIVGNRENIDSVKTYLKNRGIAYNVCSESIEGYEDITLNAIRLYNKEDGYVLYAHTKGSYTQSQGNTNWRRNLTRRLVMEWMNCIDLLDDYSAIGSRYFVLKDGLPEETDISQQPLINFRCISSSKIEARKGVFFGNFWWSHLRYLKQLKPLGKLNLDTRFEAEHWLYHLKDVVTDKRFVIFDKNPFFDKVYFSSDATMFSYNADFEPTATRLIPDDFGGWVENK